MYKEIGVNMRDDQIIRKEDWKTITTMDYFDSTIDKEKLKEFINSLPFYQTSPLGRSRIQQKLDAFLYKREEVFGLRHCDTQERENSWRIQIHINVRVFPKIIELFEYKREKNWQIGIAGEELVMLTFSIPKLAR